MSNDHCAVVRIMQIKQSQCCIFKISSSRAVRDIFQEVEVIEDTAFVVRVSFVELYNEQLFDLLSSKPRREDTLVDIREDGKGIKIPGLTEVEVGVNRGSFEE